MTDKEKIRKEVERLKSQLLRGACSSQIAMETRCKEEAYDEVLSILDSLQEESVSEDLEEAAKKYYPILRDDKGDYLRDAFKTGAQWREEQMVKNVVLETKVYLESDSDGIESEHQEWLALENNEILDIPNNIGLKDGDKVKVIIIKDEQL